MAVDGQHPDRLSLLLGTGFFVFFGWLSDKIGRKPIIMAGLLLAMLTYFPLFKALTWAGNPALAQAQATVRATVTAAPGDCKFQFNPTGTAKFTTSCDIATSFLTRNSVPYDVVTTAAAGTRPQRSRSATRRSRATTPSPPATRPRRSTRPSRSRPTSRFTTPAIRWCAVRPRFRMPSSTPSSPPTRNSPSTPPPSAPARRRPCPAADLVSAKLLTAEEVRTASPTWPSIRSPMAGAFTMVADPANVNWVTIIAVLTVLVIYVTMVYGPIAALLVELFPTRIRYTGMSLPYHIGNGWFGGLLPATAFAMSAAQGDIYYGLWYPIAIAAMSLVIGTLFVKDTLGTDLNAKD
jgi:hypothetical protein